MEEAAPAGSGTRLKWLSMALTETQRGEKKKTTTPPESKGHMEHVKDANCQIIPPTQREDGVS